MGRKKRDNPRITQDSVSCGHPVQADLMSPGTLGSCVIINNTNTVRAGLQLSYDFKGYEQILVSSMGII